MGCLPPPVRARLVLVRLLLGGCGGQLTTKLYTDEVCHFTHHPGPDGLPHLYGRHARCVPSADHLYTKSAAAAI